MKVPLCSGCTESITNVSFSTKALFVTGNQSIGSALLCPLLTSQWNSAVEFIGTLACCCVTLTKAGFSACALNVSGMMSGMTSAQETLEEFLGHDPLLPPPPPRI